MIQKGKTAVIPWPEVSIGSTPETVQPYTRSGQSIVYAWGAKRRAFLSSCMEDREWMEDEEEEVDTFYGSIQRSNTVDPYNNVPRG